ncbi:MAG: formate/nitrite transporter [Planctomycetota bacterium]|jgi:formate transporter
MTTPTTDAWAPSEIAKRVESLGVAKAQEDLISVFVLSILAGAFISLGAVFYLVVITDSQLGFGVTRFLGGLAFSLGLILVVVAGAELFTGNNLVSMAWASGRIRLVELLRNWVVVYIGNVVGALGTVALVHFGSIATLGGGAVGQTAIGIGQAKSQIDFTRGVALGILCNALVCLAVWLAIGGRSVTDKILGVLFPITAFVTIGLEHSIANWFFLPYAYVLGLGATDGYVAGAALNLFAVTLGNIAGGTLLVAGVYWLIYLRPGKHSARD